MFLSQLMHVCNHTEWVIVYDDDVEAGEPLAECDARSQRLQERWLADSSVVSFMARDAHEIVVRVKRYQEDKGDGWDDGYWGDYR